MSIAHANGHGQYQPTQTDAWPVVDGTDHMSVDLTSVFGAGNVPDPARLRAAIEVAKESLALQEDDSLQRVRSEDEITEELTQQREFRAAWRKEDALDHADQIERNQRARAHRANLEKQQADHDYKMAKEQQEHEQELSRSTRERERLLDPNVEVRKAQTAHRWLPRLALVPSFIAALVSALNLAIQGARIVEGPAAVGVILGAGIDAVFTIGLIAIMAGRMSGVVTDGWKHGKSYLVGELVIGLGLAAASIVAHHLPSADGSHHNSLMAWWFVLLPFMFGLSAVYGPKLQEDTRKRVVQASNDARMSAASGTLTESDAKALRLARWVAEQDRAGLISGERGDDGLPSAKSIERAVREHVGRCSQPTSRRIRDTYGILSGTVE